MQACEEVLTKFKLSNLPSSASTSPSHFQQVLRNLTNPVLYPLIQGCETKDPKLTKVVYFQLKREVD